MHILIHLDMKHSTITGLTLALSLLAMKPLQAQTILEPSVKSATTFAIIVDQHTYDQAKTEIDAYRAAVEKDGLGTYIISSQWSKPDEIRTILKSLYGKNSL
jgi:hypothetical protein